MKILSMHIDEEFLLNENQNFFMINYDGHDIRNTSKKSKNKEVDVMTSYIIKVPVIEEDDALIYALYYKQKKNPVLIDYGIFDKTHKRLYLDSEWNTTHAIRSGYESKMFKGTTKDLFNEIKNECFKKLEKYIEKKKDEILENEENRDNKNIVNDYFKQFGGYGKYKESAFFKDKIQSKVSLNELDKEAKYFDNWLAQNYKDRFALKERDIIALYLAKDKETVDYCLQRYLNAQAEHYTGLTQYDETPVKNETLISNRIIQNYFLKKDKNKKEH